MESQFLDTLLVLISVYQKGFAVRVHFRAEAKVFTDLLPQRSQSIIKEHQHSPYCSPVFDPVLKTSNKRRCFVKLT